MTTDEVKAQAILDAVKRLDGSSVTLIIVTLP